jgi:hypothetical protein
MSINEFYTRDLKDNLNYTATWLPNFKLSLGDVGVLSKYEFTYRTNLKKLGIPFEEGTVGSPGTYGHMSSGSVTWDIKLTGKAPLPGSALTAADAGIGFQFGNKHAVVFLATNCKVHRISDQETLKQTIFDKYKDKEWDRNYVVVTELVTAGNTTIIISNGSNGRYELRAKAGLVPAFESINVGGNFSLVHESQIGFHFLAKSGLTPLFRCMGVRAGWLRDDVVTRTDVVRSNMENSVKEDVIVDEVEYDDYRSIE